MVFITRSATETPGHPDNTTVDYKQDRKKFFVERLYPV
jgi:hypothetical protein